MAIPNEPSPARAVGQPEWADELDTRLTEGWVETPIPEPAKHWAIGSTGAAEWAMGMLADLTHRARAVGAQAAEWRYPIDEWERTELARIAPGIEFFRMHLEVYGLVQREAHPKEATIPLPSGRIETRRGTQPVVEIADEDLLIDWATEALSAADLPAVVKTEQRVLVSELRARVRPQATLGLFCGKCGEAIVEEGIHEGLWMHEGREGEPSDHPVKPGTNYETVYVRTLSNGETVTSTVPGVRVVEPKTTVTVKPT